jgi:hypothetical protein
LTSPVRGAGPGARGIVRRTAAGVTHALPVSLDSRLDSGLDSGLDPASIPAAIPASIPAIYQRS